MRWGTMINWEKLVCVQHFSSVRLFRLSSSNCPLITPRGAVYSAAANKNGNVRCQLHVDYATPPPPPPIPAYVAPPEPAAVVVHSSSTEVPVSVTASCLREPQHFSETAVYLIRAKGDETVSAFCDLVVDTFSKSCDFPWFSVCFLFFFFFFFSRFTLRVPWDTMDWFR